jgi:putative MFS transporter
MHDKSPASRAVFWRGVAVAPLAIAFLAWGLSNMDQSLFGYAVPDLMKTFGFSLDTISLIISGSFACSIVVSIAVGVLTDLWGPRVTLPLCLGISGLLVGLQGLAPTGVVFAVLRIVGYGFSGALAPITNTLAAGAAPPRGRALAVAVLQCAYPLGWFAASLIVAPLLARAGWRPAFLIGFAVVPLAALFAAGLPKRAPRAAAARAPAGAPLRELFGVRHRRPAVLLALAFLLYGGAVGGTTFYLPTFFHVVRGYSEAVSARIVGLSYAIGVIGYIGAALVSETRLGRRNTVLVWLLAGAVALTAMIWLPRTQAQDVLAFGVATVFFYGTSAIMVIYLLERFPEHLRATAAAVSGTAAISAGFMIFPIVVAQAVKAIGWSWSFTAVVAPALLLAALLVAMIPAADR